MERKTNYQNIRFKLETKARMDKLLKTINSEEEGSNIKNDTLINFLLESVDKPLIEKMKLSRLKWKDEEKRLHDLYSKKIKKVDEDQWKFLAMTGQVSDFVKEHSRLPV